MGGTKTNSTKPKTPYRNTGSVNRSKYQTPHTIATSSELLPEKTYWEYNLPAEAWSQFPEKADFRNRLIFTLESWVVSNKSLILTDFCTKYKIRKSRLYEWAAKYPDIKEALNNVREQIAAHRERGVMFGKLRETALKNIHLYEPEWLEAAKLLAALKNPDGEAEKIINVIMHAIGSTGKVKPLEVKQESNNAE